MQFDSEKYLEKCDVCGSPARTEMNVSDYPVGHDWFQFCVNPKCIQFDAVILKDEVEQKVRESKGWRRHRNRVWKKAIAEQNKAVKAKWAGIGING